MNGRLCLKCRASKGQFSDEVAVRGIDYQEKAFSFFVDKEYVETKDDPEVDEVAAFLSVIEMDRKGERVLIRLPGETFGNGHTVTVKESDLVSRMECEHA